MLVGGLVGYFLGVDSENKSLEEISDFTNDYINKKNKKYFSDN